MYRPKPIPPIRFAELSAVPSYEEMLQFCHKSRQSPGRQIEMTWYLENGYVYLLVATLQKGAIDPEWNFHMGNDRQAPLIWQHATSDVQFVHNLVVSECTGQNVQDFVDETVTSSTALLGLSSTGATESWQNVGKGTPNDASLEGHLANMPAPSLLQSVTISKMTGKLVVAFEGDIITIYFDDGNVTHATARDTRGDLAVMELLTWQNGNFHFVANERSAEKTVQKRLDALLMEGVALFDQYQYLLKTGLKMDSVLIRKKHSMTEAEFEQQVAQGAPIDLNKQKQFYITIDDVSSIFELLRKQPIAKSDWVPILFNLVSCDLVMLSEKPLAGVNRREVQSVLLDRAAIDGALKSMVRSDTGLFSHPSMLYFIEQEFHRFHAGGMPFCIMLFDLMLRKPSGLESLSTPIVREVARRLSMVKRSIDLLGHYEALSYALLLPQTDLAGAAIFSKRVTEVLMDGTMGGGIDGQNLAMAFGVFGMPEDGIDLGLGLAGAGLAKEECKRSGAVLHFFRDLRT